MYYIVLFIICLTTGYSNEYPHRKHYKNLQYLNLADFTRVYDHAIIIDSRDKFEHNAISILYSINIPREHMTEELLLKIRKKVDTQPIVFYCNGVMCLESYKATEMARKWGFKNIYCYDGGVFEFAKLNPQRIKVFGSKTNDNLKDMMLNDAGFSDKVISMLSLKEKINSEYKIYDIRHSDVQKSNPLKNVITSSFDKVIKDISDLNFSKKAIFIDDNGRRSKWLYFYLLKARYKHFYFLKSGNNNPEINLLE